jgi:alpha-methylacyl-CoA racemase
VDAAMIDGAASLMTQFYGMRAAGRWNDDRQSNPIGGGAPYSTVYETADGKHVAVVAVEDKFYDALLLKLGLCRKDLPAREVRENWPALQKRFAQIFRSKNRTEWAELLEHSDACVSSVLDMSEAPAHPHNIARKAFIERDGHPIPAAAPRFRGTPTGHAPQSRGPAKELLLAWGAGKETVEALMALSKRVP